MVVVTRILGTEEWETAIYGRGALPAMREQLETGNYRIVGFFPQVRVRALPEATPARQEAPAAPLPSVLNPYRVEFYA